MPGNCGTAPLAAFIQSNWLGGRTRASLASLEARRRASAPQDRRLSVFDRGVEGCCMDESPVRADCDDAGEAECRASWLRAASGPPVGGDVW